MLKCHSDVNYQNATEDKRKSEASLATLLLLKNASFSAQTALRESRRIAHGIRHTSELSLNKS